MKVLTKDGVELAVMRPENPQLAMDLALKLANGPKHASREEAQAALQEILQAQPYTFVGLAGDPRCCDRETVDVPDDSREAKISYCPKHGRHHRPEVFVPMPPLLDPEDHDKIVGEAQPGDSFVSWPDLQKAERLGQGSKP